MTYVMNSSILSSLPTSRDILKEYWIEVITFDGESEYVTVYAYNEYEAQGKPLRCSTMWTTSWFTMFANSD